MSPDLAVPTDERHVDEEGEVQVVGQGREHQGLLILLKAMDQVLGAYDAGAG